MENRYVMIKTDDGWVRKYFYQIRQDDIFQVYKNDVAVSEIMRATSDPYDMNGQLVVDSERVTEDGTTIS